jgi:hypothetical protein
MMPVETITVMVVYSIFFSHITSGWIGLAVLSILMMLVSKSEPIIRGPLCRIITIYDHAKKGGVKWTLDQ